MRIHVVVVLAVVLVVRRGDEDRVQVDDVHAQVLKVVQLFHDSLQVAAVEIPDVHALGRGVPVLHPLHVLVEIAVLAGQHVICRIPVAETVRVDLVHDRPVGPLRRREARCDPERVSLRKVAGDPHLVVVEDHVLDLQLKIVADHRLADVDRHLIKIKTAARIRDLHALAHGSADEIDLVDVVFHRPKPDFHLLAGHRAYRIPVGSRLVTEDRPFPEDRPHQRDVAHFVHDIVSVTHFRPLRSLPVLCPWASPPQCSPGSRTGPRTPPGRSSPSQEGARRKRPEHPCAQE